MPEDFAGDDLSGTDLSGADLTDARGMLQLRLDL